MLIGRATKPIMDNESNSASFKIAVQSESTYACHNTYTFDCVGFGSKAKQIIEKVYGGNLVAVDGSLRNFNYTDNTGYTHTHTEIVVHDLFLIDKPKDY